MNQVLRVISARNIGIHSKGSPITSITSKYKKIHRSQRLHHSKPLDLNYKKNSPRADTKIQSLLLPKGNNPDTFREKKACCKNIWMVQNITNPLLASDLLPDMFCNKNNAISPEAIGGETTTVPTQKSFWRGFHQLPIKTTRMAAMWEAKMAAWEITSVCAACKHSSSTYKDKSSTPIRRSSNLKQRTPIGTHRYNCKDWGNKC